MKRLLMCLLALACVFVCNDSFAAKDSKEKSKKSQKSKKNQSSKFSAVWHVNLEKALAEAKSRKCPVMLLITGSTWCGPCKYLEKNVFSSKEFSRYARKSLVLLKADIPGGGKNISADGKKILKKYPANGVPTVYILDASGNVLEKQGGSNKGDSFKNYIKRFKTLKK